MLSHSFAKLIFDKFIANNIRTTSAYVAVNSL